jgi:Na+-driven multidrug efflux pump
MLLPTICLGVLTRIVSDFGQAAVAGYGVAGKIEGFGLIIFIAVSTVFSPFVGQNWGALKINRVRKALTKMLHFSLGWGTLQAILLFACARPIANIFNRDPNVLPYIVLYLQIIPISYGILSITYIASSTFNAIGHPLPGIFLMVVRLLVLHIPLAILGKKWGGYTGFLIAYHVAAVFTSVWSYSWIRQICKNKQYEVNATLQTA